MGGNCEHWVKPGTLDYTKLLANLSSQAPRLKRPVDGAGAIMDHIEMVRRQGSGAGMGGGSAPDAMEFLEHSLLWLNEQQPGKPIRSVETGFALGYSAMSIIGAACTAGLTIQHSAMDPFQSAWWKGLGQKQLKTLCNKCPSDAVRFEHMELPAVVGLSRMYERGECVQLAYMDDGHRFDDNMVELHLINAMMPAGARTSSWERMRPSAHSVARGAPGVAGGILAIDDTLMPSVGATITYIEANLPFLRVKINNRFVAFVKHRADKRSWNHFSPFYANFTAGFGKHKWFLKNADAITKHKPLLPKKSQQPQFDGVQADEAEGPTPE